jgi:hypothetical protein
MLAWIPLVFLSVFAQTETSEPAQKEKPPEARLGEESRDPYLEGIYEQEREVARQMARQSQRRLPWWKKVPILYDLSTPVPRFRPYLTFALLLWLFGSAWLFQAVLAWKFLDEPVSFPRMLAVSLLLWPAAAALVVPMVLVGVPFPLLVVTASGAIFIAWSLLATWLMKVEVYNAAIATFIFQVTQTALALMLLPWSPFAPR